MYLPNGVDTFVTYFLNRRVVGVYVATATPVLRRPLTVTRPYRHGMPPFVPAALLTLPHRRSNPPPPVRHRRYLTQPYAWRYDRLRAIERGSRDHLPTYYTVLIHSRLPAVQLVNVIMVVLSDSYSNVISVLFFYTLLPRLLRGG